MHGRIPMIGSALLVLLCLVSVADTRTSAQSGPRALDWPAESSLTRPWAYWHWMGSAVDRENLSSQLKAYSDAGMGGMHIVPIYGARGYENRYIKFLSPRWMEMLDAAVGEARRVGLGIDMTLGTGWNFGGPESGGRLANANVVVQTVAVSRGESPQARFDASQLQALIAYPEAGSPVDLSRRLRSDGTLDWIPDTPALLYAISQRPSGNPVDRAAPGNEGPMLNPFFGEAIRNYLRPFEAAFPKGTTAVPRAFYHDSYEYVGDWSPDLFSEFEKRRGYRLQEQLPAMFGKEADERSRRVRADYRETISDLLVENFMPPWVDWAHKVGASTRNQAHGSPGNLLDLYAAADIPETEMFRHDREVLVSKMASSAAHVAGKNLVAAETGTWIAEHFTETLGELKGLIDEMFVSGVNHIFYHGTCYSPSDAPWPGWLFYASTQMNPRNAIWRDVPVLNRYISRSQALLQGGTSDNDILLYWPIHDLWHTAEPRLPHFSVHRRSWLDQESIGPAARLLQNNGFAFDYISDRQLAGATAAGSGVKVPGGTYRLVVVPTTRVMPETTLAKLLALAEAGATVAFESGLPSDVPGWGRLDQRRATLRTLLSKVRFTTESPRGTKIAGLGRGRVLAGGLAGLLSESGVRREALADNSGLWFVRRKAGQDTLYFLVNSSQQRMDRWIPLAAPGRSAAFMDPMSGTTGVGASRSTGPQRLEVYASLEAGATLIVRLVPDPGLPGPRWRYWAPPQKGLVVDSAWDVRFIEGGPQLPRPARMSRPGSWAALDDPEAQRFAGTAVYSTQLSVPVPPVPGVEYSIDLGSVKQSARVRLDGLPVGSAIVSPFVVHLGALKPGEHRLEVEVTSTSANRIRDLDRRGVQWKIFHNINFVNVDYKPFDASGWPLHDAGLLGPVRLLEVTPVSPR